ncbi:hypothetical protein ABZY05_48770 [Streptomyces canus]|uniref:hypothetical protein n=1 Tax=Streptomyces canus TaxID=58343 RepID=UPI00339F342A
MGGRQLQGPIEELQVQRLVHLLATRTHPVQMYGPCVPRLTDPLEKQRQLLRLAKEGGRFRRQDIRLRQECHKADREPSRLIPPAQDGQGGDPVEQECHLVGRRCGLGPRRRTERSFGPTGPQKGNDLTFGDEPMRPRRCGITKSSRGGQCTRRVPGPQTRLQLVQHEDIPQDIGEVGFGLHQKLPHLCGDVARSEMYGLLIAQALGEPELGKRFFDAPAQDTQAPEIDPWLHGVAQNGCFSAFRCQLRQPDQLRMAEALGGAEVA